MQYPHHAPLSENATIIIKKRRATARELLEAVVA